MVGPTHAKIAKFLVSWHERNSWGEIARSLLGLKQGEPLGDEEKREVGRISTLLSAQARGATRSDEVMRLLGHEPRITPYHTIAFKIDDTDDFHRLRELFKQHGETYREVAEKLLSGELELKKP